jgi:hypothetical protein
LQVYKFPDVEPVGLEYLVTIDLSPLAQDQGNLQFLEVSVNAYGSIKNVEFLGSLGAKNLPLRLRLQSSPSQ